MFFLGGQVSKVLEEKKYPFGFQKLEARSFRFHRVEEVYTEKMITLSNVSRRLAPRSPEELCKGGQVVGAGLGEDHFI